MGSEMEKEVQKEKWVVHPQDSLFTSVTGMLVKKNRLVAFIPVKPNVSGVGT